MANEQKSTSIVEKCVADVELRRVVGSFVNDDGEAISYVKYAVSVDDADLEISFDKSVKNMLDKFVPFKEVEEEA